MREKTDEVQKTKNVKILGIKKFSCTIFFKISFEYLFKVFCIVYCYERSKNSQISRSLINFQGEILIIREFQ